MTLEHVADDEVIADMAGKAQRSAAGITQKLPIWCVHDQDAAQQHARRHRRVEYTLS